MAAMVSSNSNLHKVRKNTTSKHRRKYLCENGYSPSCITKYFTFSQTKIIMSLIKKYPHWLNSFSVRITKG